MRFCSYCDKASYTSKLLQDGSMKFYCLEHALNIVVDQDIIMHDHENIVLATGSGITEMQLMWIIMGAMAIHHIWMWWKMKKKDCNCK